MRKTLFVSISTLLNVFFVVNRCTFQCHMFIPFTYLITNTSNIQVQQILLIYNTFAYFFFTTNSFSNHFYRLSIVKVGVPAPYPGNYFHITTSISKSMLLFNFNILTMENIFFWPLSF